MGASAGALAARATYRYLRLMLITLPALLLVSTTLAFFWLGIIETSISAYYLGPIRDVFVGVMMAIAACLVAYRGSSPLEDFSLDVAGFCAIFVALVPTDLGLTLAALDPPQRAELVASLRASTVAVLVVSAMFVLVEARTAPWAPAPFARHRPTRVIAAVTNVVLVGFVALVGWRVVDGGEFAWVHGWAAVLFIAALAVAVGSHGWPQVAGGARDAGSGSAGSRDAGSESAGSRDAGSHAAGARDAGGADHRGRYRVIFFLMVAGAPLYGVLELVGWDYAVLAVEWYVVALFALFWVFETRRTWAAEPFMR